MISFKTKDIAIWMVSIPLFLALSCLPFLPLIQWTPTLLQSAMMLAVFNLGRVTGMFKMDSFIMSIMGLLFSVVVLMASSWFISLLFSYSTLFRDGIFVMVAAWVSILLAFASLESWRLRYESSFKSAQYDRWFLNRQFDTHLTKNVMTDIYVRAVVIDEQLANTIEELGRFLTSSAKMVPDQMIELSQEIDYIKDYIALNSVITEDAQVNFKVSGEISNFSIYPRIFIGLVENAFMHGQRFSEEDPIDIEIVANGTISCKVFNLIGNPNKKSSGLGNTNLMHMLNHYYPDRHIYKVEQTATTYQCQIVLQPN